MLPKRQEGKPRPPLDKWFSIVSELRTLREMLNFYPLKLNFKLLLTKKIKNYMTGSGPKSVILVMWYNTVMTV